MTPPSAAKPAAEDGSKRSGVNLRLHQTSLGDIAARLRDRLGALTVVGDPDVYVEAVRFDHRAIRRSAGSLAAGSLADGTPARGELFCCLPGEHADGHDFAAEARRAGAVAFICERDLGEAAGGAPQLIVEAGRARGAMAHAACLVWSDPATRIRTFGVTGTNGKTTTVHLIASILRVAGYSASTIGTLSGARTTPESPDLQERFESVRVVGNQKRQPGAVALEVTSHALAQQRVDGYRHDVAVFTNLSQDHLDYHKTMEAYFEAKARLFTPEHAVVGVANSSDPYGRRLLDEATIPMRPFGLREAQDLELSAGRTRFRLASGEEVDLPLVGRFNVENALAAAAAARAFGLPDDVIAEGLSQAGTVPGRLEKVQNALGLSVLVDYAHTPDGLDKACRALRDLLGPGARLIVVFGAGGDRDREKRPLMAHNVSSHADVVVVTSDNPRHEDPAAIIDEILAGADGTAELHVEQDRRVAIAMALGLARDGDIVLVAGKGHETTQQIGDELVPFDDRNVVGEEAERLAGAA